MASILNRTVLLLTALVLASNAVAQTTFADYDYGRWSQEVTECDRQAAHGRDPGHVGPPVTRSGMNKEAAIAACQAAVAADPDNPRLNYQLGRAYGYAGRGEEAMPYRLKALEAEYPQSLFVIGYLHLLGQTIEKDVCQTLAYWRRGAHFRRLAALVALPRHVMRGDFSECPDVPDNAALAAYLGEARELSSDYYVGMLIDELEKDVAARQPAHPRVQRTNMVVSDLERALTLYRDVLGFELQRSRELGRDSYAYEVFEFDRNATITEAFLAAPNQPRVLGLTEVRGVTITPVAKPNRVAFLVEVPSVAAVAQKAQSMGLTLFADDYLTGAGGQQVHERGLLDWDGNLIVVFSYQ